MTRNSLFAMVFACGLSACGGGGHSTPSTPVTPTPIAQNHNPSITQLSVSPAFGVSQLSPFSLQAAGTDQDSDALTYEWDLGDGTTGSGTSLTKTFNNEGSITVKLTLKDGKGGSASDTRSVTVGSMTGTWDVDIPTFVPLQLTLQQDGGVVTGTFVQMKDSFVTKKGTTGKTDPAEPGKIDASGNVEIRFKVSFFLDFYLRGQMDATGRRITGGVFGSGFGGDNFTATKQ